MSQEPDKRVFAVLVTIAPFALFLSVSDGFMHLSLTLREGFLSSSAISYHTSVSQALQQALRTVRPHLPYEEEDCRSRRSRVFRLVGLGVSRARHELAASSPGRWPATAHARCPRPPRCAAWYQRLP